MLGVPIGTVDTVTPAGTTVNVSMSYDPTIKLPANVKAVVVAPSVVGDRVIQLTPVYKSGPTLPDGAHLDTSRTAVPLELDQIYQSLDDLAVGLGPQGANKDGSLTRLLNSTARNFGGEGAQFHDTIHNLSMFTSTLDHNKGALFSTAHQIDRFVSTLAQNDQTVRNFNDSLAGASDVLAGERQDLSAALKNLGVAMEQVSSFVRDNKQALSSNIHGLVKVTDILVHQRAALDETLRDAPVALANLYHTYNPRAGTLDTRANLGENFNQIQSNPAGTLCSLTSSADPSGKLCQQFQQMFGRSAPGTGSKAAASHKVVVIEPIDKTLAGIVGAHR
jgi:phospholipid/cholesterol/gamma-HCH transport system substrate-binding protein